MINIPNISLVGMAQLVGIHLVHQKIPPSIPSQGACPGWWAGLLVEGAGGSQLMLCSYMDDFLFSPLLFLKINKILL